MKSAPIHILATLALCAASLPAQIAGSLNPPPGPPTPVMRTLDYIESRVPLVEGAPGVTVAPTGTITIVAPGSYFLTADLAVTGGDGISIDSSRVTLDLRGFAISSTAGTAAGDGIDINGSHITISNGHIASGTTFDGGATGDRFTGPGFINGVLANSVSSHKHIRIRNLTVAGCDLHGIYCAHKTTAAVESCLVSTVGSVGIHAGLVRDCLATTCGSYGIFADLVTNCRASSVGQDGINAAIVRNCSGSTSSSDPGSHGIESSDLVQNSTGLSFGGDGIHGFKVSGSKGTTSFTTDPESDGIEAQGTVRNSYGRSGGGDGIAARLVINSEGQSTSTNSASKGIDASAVHQSIGTGAAGSGIDADVVVACLAESAGGSGIEATEVVANSSGTTGANQVAFAAPEALVASSWASGDSKGITGSTVTHCDAQAMGRGIDAHLVHASRGRSGGGSAPGIAAGSVSASAGTGETGIESQLVTNSWALGTAKGIGSSKAVSNSYGHGADFGITSALVNGSYGSTDPGSSTETRIGISGTATNASYGKSTSYGISGTFVSFGYGIGDAIASPGPGFDVWSTFGVGNHAAWGNYAVTYKYLSP